MPELPVPQAALLQIEGRMDGQMTLNDLTFVNSGAVTIANLSALVVAIGTWVSGSLAPQLSEDWSSLRVIGTDLSDPVGPRIENSVVVTGGVASESAPNNVAACVSFRTAQRGRSGRGRNYVPGIPNVNITLNTIDSTYITNLLTIYAALIGAGTFSAGWQWCVVSRFLNGAQRTPPITIPIVDVTMVGTSVRSMRSREVGHGA